MIDLWKETKNLKPNGSSSSQCTNGITVVGNLADTWRGHFNEMLNSINNDVDCFFK